VSFCAATRRARWAVDAAPRPCNARPMLSNPRRSLRSVRAFAPSFAFASSLAVLGFACSSNTTTAGGSTVAGLDAAPEAAEPDSDASSDASSGSTIDSATPMDAAPDTNVDVPLNDAGCLTFAGASKICGFSSNDEICKLSVSCGSSTDDGQCKINCEMGTTVKCYKAADVKCLENALAAKSCTALKACGWIL
jgi:hypothetical protein